MEIIKLVHPGHLDIPKEKDFQNGTEAEVNLGLESKGKNDDPGHLVGKYN